MYGVKNCKEARIKVAKVLKANKTAIFTKIIFPESLPHIFVGLRISISIALILVVVAEMFIGTKYGLGRLISDSHLMFRISTMYVAIFTTGILGYVLNKIFLLVETRVFHWAGKWGIMDYRQNYELKRHKGKVTLFLQREKPSWENYIWNCKKKVVYGPVQSRRLGNSLGINLFPSEFNICTFDCIYCDCGHTQRNTHLFSIHLIKPILTISHLQVTENRPITLISPK